MSSSLCAGFLQLWQVGGTLCCGAWASHCGGFSCGGAQSLGTWASAVVAWGLSSCGSQALEHRLSSCVSATLNQSISRYFKVLQINIWLNLRFKHFSQLRDWPTYFLLPHMVTVYWQSSCIPWKWVDVAGLPVIFIGLSEMSFASRPLALDSQIPHASLTKAYSTLYPCWENSHTIWFCSLSPEMFFHCATSTQCLS